MDKRLRHIGLLRCFDAAARYQSYSKAADELAISQAAVSQQIRNLETHLNVKLFQREGRQMRLTQQGQTLAGYVKDAFRTLSTGFDQVQVEPEDGVLTVTAALSFSSLWLVPRLWKFAARYPNISVRAVSSVQFEDVRYSDIDVAIRQADHIDTDLYSEVLLQDPVYPYCSPNLPKHMTLNTPADLARCGLVEPINPGRFSWKNWFNIAGVKVSDKLINWIEVTTWEMGINAIVGGHGVCLATESLAQDLVAQGILVRPFDIAIEPGVTFTLIYDETSPKLARIQVFNQWLKEEMGLASTSPG